MGHGASPSPQIRVVDGLRWELDLREVIDASLFFSGSFEPRAERAIARHLGADMTAIDVGANVGYHALRMARQVGPSGQVIAIEPAPGVDLAGDTLDQSVHVPLRVVEEKGDRDPWRARGRLSGTRTHRATIGEKAVAIKPRGLRATLAPRDAGEEDRA